MEWKKIEEDGLIFYINNEYGNIAELSENSFIVIMPKAVKLGPFESLDQAKQIMVQNKKSLDELIDNFNDSIMQTIKEVKNG